MTGLLDFIYDSEIFVDLYEILEVDMDIKINEIKLAYIKLAKKNHPDQGGNNEKFQKITKAYEILYNKETRKEYDLYYLKKNMDEFKCDDMIRLKDEFQNFVNSNKKPITKEELDKLYTKTFDEYNIKQDTINQEEFITRLNDIEIERKNIQIETVDDTLKNFINEHNKNDHNNNIDVNEIFEYIKYKNTDCLENSIIKNDWDALDLVPINFGGYSLFTDENKYFDSNLYSNISEINSLIPKESVNNLNIDEFVAWKNTKRMDTKLSESDVNTYLKKRDDEQQILFKQIENDLTTKSKRKEVEKFIKTKYLAEDINKYCEDKNDSKKKHSNLLNLHKSNVPELIDLDDPNSQITNKSSLFEKSSDIDGMLKFMENIKIEKTENLDELENELSLNSSYKTEIDGSSFQELKVNSDISKVNNVRKREFK